ncbi:MAG: hypothetical protein WAK25_20105, partial [Acidobacteriaceae bacterium]
MNLTVAIWDGCSLVGRGLQGGVRRLERGFTTGHRSGVPVLVHGQYLGVVVGHLDMREHTVRGYAACCGVNLAGR